MPTGERIDCRIPARLAGKRLDQALADLLPVYSRARLQQWIKSGQIQVDGRARQPKERVFGGETISGTAQSAEAIVARAEAIPLRIHYEDADILIVNKPPGLVVHPAVGNPDGTLVNALLHYAPELAMLPRAGIVHRLDKNTSGLLVVARSLKAHVALIEQLQTRTMGREYLTIVNGLMTAGGTVDAHIARHPVDRKRMAVSSSGKPAVTHYRVAQRYRAHTLLRVKLETGRTHQIRVHMAYIRFPIVGDPVYGGRLRLPLAASADCRERLRGFRRQALHAVCLRLKHPASGETLSWDAELPTDMADLVNTLSEDAESLND